MLPQKVPLSEGALARRTVPLCLRGDALGDSSGTAREWRLGAAGPTLGSLGGRGARLSLLATEPTEPSLIVWQTPHERQIYMEAL